MDKSKGFSGRSSYTGAVSAPCHHDALILREILAPVLRDSGKYYAAGFALTANRTPEWRKKMQRQLQSKLAARPDLYDRVIVTELSIPERTDMAPPGTADMVLTFRNVHNWMKGDYASGMFEAMGRCGAVLSGLASHF